MVVSYGPGSPPPPSGRTYASQAKQDAWTLLEAAANEHARCVANAMALPPGPPRDGWVTKILQAGAGVDRWLAHALEHGWTPQELAQVPSLHATYVEALTAPPL